MALNIENIIAEIKEATILELNDLVKAIEEEFGVTAAAPVAVAAAGAGDGFQPYAGGTGRGHAQRQRHGERSVSAGYGGRPQGVLRHGQCGGVQHALRDADGRH